MDDFYASYPVTGGANKTLSNLTAPTAINVDLLPASNNTQSLGGTNLAWAAVFTSEIADPAGLPSIFPQSRQLLSNTSTLMFDWSTAGTLLAGTNLISNVVDPVSAQDAATKNYVDTHASAPAGAAGQLQYNSGSSSLAASSHLTYDSSAQTLYIGSVAPGGSPWITWQTVIANPIPLVLLGGYTGSDHGIAFVCSGVANLQGVLGDGSATNLTLQASGGNVGIGTAATGSDLLTIGGSVAVSGPIHNVTDPALPQDAATKAYVDATAGGANTALSNLASVAINASLVPGTTGTIDLGSTSKLMRDIFIGSADQGLVLVNSGSVVTTATMYPIATTPSGVSNVPAFSATAGGTNFNIGMFTQSSSAANAAATGDVLIETGNKVAGTGNSGNIIMTFGTSSGGSKGTLKLANATSTTGAQTGTFTNVPGAAGPKNPTGYLTVSINGTTSYIPYFQ